MMDFLQSSTFCYFPPLQEEKKTFLLSIIFLYVFLYILLTDMKQEWYEIVTLQQWKSTIQVRYLLQYLKKNRQTWKKWSWCLLKIDCLFHSGLKSARGVYRLSSDCVCTSFFCLSVTSSPSLSLHTGETRTLRHIRFKTRRIIRRFDNLATLVSFTACSLSPLSLLY